MATHRDILVDQPGVRSALDRFKLEVANEIARDGGQDDPGLQEYLQTGYGGNMKAKTAGAIGGHMVRHMIEIAEEALVSADRTYTAATTRDKNPRADRVPQRPAGAGRGKVQASPVSGEAIAQEAQLQQMQPGQPGTMAQPGGARQQDRRGEAPIFSHQALMAEYGNQNRQPDTFVH